MNLWEISVDQWRKRVWWLNLLLLFCLYMTFLYMPYDVIWKSVAQDEDVWFGITLHGWPAKAGGVLHWFIYGAGAFGLWHSKSWIWPWAALYVTQVSIAMLLWNLLDPRGDGVLAGMVAASVFAIPAVALWRGRAHFPADDRE